MMITDGDCAQLAKRILVDGITFDDTLQGYNRDQSAREIGLQLQGIDDPNKLACLYLAFTYLLEHQIDEDIALKWPDGHDVGSDLALDAQWSILYRVAEIPGEEGAKALVDLYLDNRVATDAGAGFIFVHAMRTRAADVIHVIDNHYANNAAAGQLKDTLLAR